MKTLVIFALAGVLIYTASAAYLYFTQDDKIFNRKWAKEYIPQNGVKILNFKTGDGVLLKGGMVEHGKKLPLVLYFGGNANNVLEFLDKTAFKMKNYNFLAFNYPGYDGSGGKPCEKCILKYAAEIYDKYKPDIVMGRSLGSAVAAYTASLKKVDKLVLITPFDSIVNIAKSKYPFFPVHFLVRHKFEEYKWVRKVKAPVNVLIIENDDVIPLECTENLLKNIPNLNKKIVIKNIRHGYIYEYEKIVPVLNQLIDG
ncbi:alpha/beta hydrolase [Nautilia sp.]